MPTTEDGSGTGISVARGVDAPSRPIRPQVEHGAIDDFAEMQRRVRNLLAAIRWIVRRTAETSDGAEEMWAHLDGRLDAFARVQAMAMRRPDVGIDLALLIEDVLITHAARESGRVRVAGPELALCARAAETVSLALHELITNAIKYGALASGNGQLVIGWRCDAGQLHFLWEERGLPIALAPPGPMGFGLELLCCTLPEELEAEVHVAFPPRGMCFSLSAPLARLIGPSGR